jgi:hypothetical protein
MNVQDVKEISEKEIVFIVSKFAEEYLLSEG